MPPSLLISSSKLCQGNSSISASSSVKHHCFQTSRRSHSNIFFPSSKYPHQNVKSTVNGEYTSISINFLLLPLDVSFFGPTPSGTHLCSVRSFQYTWAMPCSSFGKQSLSSISRNSTFLLESCWILILIIGLETMRESRGRSWEGQAYSFQACSLWVPVGDLQVIRLNSSSKRRKPLLLTYGVQRTVVVQSSQ